MTSSIECIRAARIIEFLKNEFVINFLGIMDYTSREIQKKKDILIKAIDKQEEENRRDEDFCEYCFDQEYYDELESLVIPLYHNLEQYENSISNRTPLVIDLFIKYSLQNQIGKKITTENINIVFLSRFPVFLKIFTKWWYDIENPSVSAGAGARVSAGAGASISAGAGAGAGASVSEDIIKKFYLKLSSEIITWFENVYLHSKSDIDYLYYYPTTRELQDALGL